jgi:hypothetical protein
MTGIRTAQALLTIGVALVALPICAADDAVIGVQIQNQRSFVLELSRMQLSDIRAPATLQRLTGWNPDLKHQRMPAFDGTQARAYHRVTDPASNLTHLYLTVNTTDVPRYQGASFSIHFRQDRYCIRLDDIESVFGNAGKPYAPKDALLVKDGRYHSWLFTNDAKAKVSFSFQHQECAESVTVWNRFD